MLVCAGLDVSPALNKCVKVKFPWIWMLRKRFSVFAVSASSIGRWMVARAGCAIHYEQLFAFRWSGEFLASSQTLTYHSNTHQTSEITPKALWHHKMSSCTEDRDLQKFQLVFSRFFFSTRPNVFCIRSICIRTNKVLFLIRRHDVENGCMAQQCIATDSDSSTQSRWKNIWKMIRYCIFI